MKYTIKSGDEIATANTLAEAKLVAGEWLADRERSVTIECSERPGRQFLATVFTNEKFDIDIALVAQWIPDDAKPSPDNQISFASDVQFSDPELERARRVAIYAVQVGGKECRRMSRGRPAKMVRCIANDTIYPSISHAAEFAGIARESMLRKVKNGDGWEFVGSERVA